AIKTTRIGEWLDHAAIRAAESRHVADETESKLIVKDSVVSSDHGLGCCRPREADARREVFLRHKLRVVIPAHAEVQRQVRQKLPIILDEERVVVVAQMNLVGCRCQSTRGGDCKEPGVEWSKLDEV